MGQVLSNICCSICGEGVAEFCEREFQQKLLVPSPSSGASADESAADAAAYALRRNPPIVASPPSWEICSPSRSLISPTSPPFSVTDSDSITSSLSSQNLPIPSPNLGRCVGLSTTEDVPLIFGNLEELNSRDSAYECIASVNVINLVKDESLVSPQHHESKQKIGRRPKKITQARKEEENLKKQGLGEEKWIKHYSSHQNILLVGEGDFSFSTCLAVAFGSAVNMVATSLNSKDFLTKNYKNAPDNIQNLRDRGCKVMHGVDATKMSNRRCFRGKSFDRIIFNFPHAGFSRKKESQEAQICQHQELVRLFLENAMKLIGHGGEIHISHKSNGFHSRWNLEQLASSVGLRLIGKVRFKLSNYPGYNTKFGYGGDGNFDCKPSHTYKFGL